MVNHELIRDKEQTMSKLLNAFDTILIEDGFQKLGINSIAKKAGVSKVLIYRYFNDFNGLLEAYLEHKSFWLSVENTDADALKRMKPNDLKNVALSVFDHLLDNLLKNVEQQEIRRWEIMEYNEVIDRIGKKIEAPSSDRNKIIARLLSMSEEQVAGIVGILIGGIYYLILRSKTTESFNGINLREVAGMEQLKKSISFIINKLFIT